MVLGEVSGAPQYVPSERCGFCLDIMAHMMDLKQEVLRVPLRRKKNRKLFIRLDKMVQ